MLFCLGSWEATGGLNDFGDLKGVSNLITTYRENFWGTLTLSLNYLLNGPTGLRQAVT